MSEPDYRQILNALADAVVTADGSGRITYVNNAAAQLLGWPDRELIGRFVCPMLRSTVDGASPALE